MKIKAFDLFKLPMISIASFFVAIVVIGYMMFVKYMRFSREIFEEPNYLNDIKRIFESAFHVFYFSFYELSLFFIMLVIIFYHNKVVEFSKRNILISTSITCIFVVFCNIFDPFYTIYRRVRPFFEEFLGSNFNFYATNLMYFIGGIILTCLLSYLITRFASKDIPACLILESATVQRISFIFYALLVVLLAIIIAKSFGITPIKLKHITYSDAERTIEIYKYIVSYAVVFVASFIFICGWARKTLDIKYFNSEIPIKKLFVSATISLVLIGITGGLLYVSLIYIGKLAKLVVNNSAHLWYIYAIVFTLAFTFFFVMLLKKAHSYFKIFTVAVFVGILAVVSVVFFSHFADRRVFILGSFIPFFSATCLWLISCCCTLPLKRIFHS